MLTRRAFLRRGMSAAAIGLMTQRTTAFFPPLWPLTTRPPAPGDSSRPFAEILLNPASVAIGGLPFASGFTGDFFSNDSIPFHPGDRSDVIAQLPAATEELDVAIVGGGLSGLATAYLLRRHNPVLLDLRPRFGGNAQGEIWAQTPYCIGSAYVIAPDQGSFLEGLYRELALDRAARVSMGADPVELGGVLHDDFWTGAGLSAAEQDAFRRYAELVTDVAENHYPNIPLTAGKDNQWIVELDRSSLRKNLEARMGMAVPPLLASAIQAYCHSAFAAGWEEVSAASGWNFLAGEESGRWVFPGGNCFMADALWRELCRLERPRKGDNGVGPGRLLRAGCKVIDVRLTDNGRVQVTYIQPDGRVHSLSARRVVMGCAKFLCRRVIQGLAELDREKHDAVGRLDYRAYLVVNVLLDTPIEREFYDAYLLGSGRIPMNESEAAAESGPVDLLNSTYVRGRPQPHSVLTFYWPLPFKDCRVRVIDDNAWQDHAEQLVPHVKKGLNMLNIPAGTVRQVRMTRWGHPLPLARVGLIADGTLERLRRPIENRIFFVNQDNWALPAVETCLLEAQTFSREVVNSL